MTREMRERPREARDAHADTDTNTLYTISRVCARMYGLYAVGFPAELQTVENWCGVCTRARTGLSPDTPAPSTYFPIAMGQSFGRLPTPGRRMLNALMAAQRRWPDPVVPHPLASPNDASMPCSHPMGSAMQAPRMSGTASPSMHRVCPEPKMRDDGEHVPLRSLRLSSRCLRLSIA